MGTPTPAGGDPAGGPADLDRRLADAVERLGHGLRALAQRTARAEGLTPLQQQAVLALAVQPEHRREVGALAAEFDVTPPTMSDAVAALSRKGLVRRTVGRDARRRALTLTAEGQELADRIAGWDRPLTDALALTRAADKGAALDVLLGVIGELTRTGTISVARTCTTCRFFARDAHDDPAAPHHCRLLDLPLPRSELRTDCPEHRLPAPGDDT
ncbi:MAG TPA: MarR family winged helix-turn-helix transcriptional regulator [Pseudonocardia sp.]|nr:MarR family winged helix-turn-helix transcriptional regulator [Pseudonocardia sp.]